MPATDAARILAPGAPYADVIEMRQNAHESVLYIAQFKSSCYIYRNCLIGGGAMLSSSLLKYGFRIRTRHGLVVESLTIQGRDEADAERKLRQMYLHCEILARTVSPGMRKPEQLSFEDVASLLSK
jgi:hypothetical protein